MRKPNKIKLDALNPGQLEYLRRWMWIEKITCDEAASRCQSQFGLQLSGEAIRRWYQKIEKEKLADRALKAALARVSDSAATATAKVQALEELKDPFWAALKAEIGQRTFEKCQAGEDLPIETLKDLTAIMAVGLKSNYDTEKLAQGKEKLSQSRAKLELELQKYKDAVAAIQREMNAAKSSGGISPETMTRIESELKLL